MYSKSNIFNLPASNIRMAIKSKCTEDTKFVRFLGIQIKINIISISRRLIVTFQNALHHYVPYACVLALLHNKRAPEKFQFDFGKTTFPS